MKIVTGLALSVAALALCQCAPPKKKLPPQPSFSVSIVMTPDALAKLKATGDSMQLDAYYYGFPKPGTKPDLDQLGRVILGDETYDIKAGASQITIQPTELDPEFYPMVTEPYVRVTGVTVGLPEDALDCSNNHITLANAAKSGVTVTCDIKRSPD